MLYFIERTFIMKAKKTLALLLAAMMAATSLVACNNQKPNTPNGDAPQSGANIENALSMDEIKAQIEAKVGKSEDDSKVIMTLDGYEVTYSEYRYYYLNYVKQFATYFGTDFESNEEYAEQFDTYFEQALKMNGLVYNAATAAGISLTQEEFDELVADVYDETIEQFGEDALTILDESYSITPYYLMINETIYNLYQKLYDATYGIGGEKYEQIKAETLDYYNENGYMRAKHILLQFPSNDDGSDVTDEQKAELYTKMQEILEKAKSGESFDELIATYNEDPGMETYTGGYYFTDGEMVEEFENATKALADNEISDIVESPYGYHIILRLPLEDESIVDSDKYSELAYTDFDAYFTDKIENTDFVKLDGFDEAVAPAIAEKDAYIADLLVQQEAAGADDSTDEE